MGMKMVHSVIIRFSTCSKLLINLVNIALCDNHFLIIMIFCMLLQFRFTLLSHAACEAPLVLPLGGYTYGEKCLFLVNDWHASLVPMYVVDLAAFNILRTLFVCFL